MGRNWEAITGVGFTVLAFGGILTLVVAEERGIDLTAVGPLGALERWLAGVTVPFGELEILYLAMSGAFVLVGLNAVRRGTPAFARAYRLWSKDPVPIGDLHLRSGAVEMEGVAEPMEEYGTVTSSYTRTPCLAFRAQKKKERRSGRNDDNNWTVVEEGEASRPFTVTDDTGTVVVDPTGATLTFGRDVVSNTGRTIETEWRLEPGETVYVSGQKCDGSDGSGPGEATTYVGGGEDTDSFTVSDASEWRTVLRFSAKGAVLSLLGLVLLGAAAYLLYGFLVV